MSLIGRYTLNLENVTLDRNTYYLPDANGVPQCSIFLAGRFLCDANRQAHQFDPRHKPCSTTRSTTVLRPTNGSQVVLGADVAGLGGSVRYARISANACALYQLGQRLHFLAAR